MPPKKPKKIKNKDKWKAWLKAKGHSTTKIDAPILNTPEDEHKFMFELHGLNP